jgi:hypothetical protein
MLKMGGKPPKRGASGHPILDDVLEAFDNGNSRLGCHGVIKWE